MDLEWLKEAGIDWEQGVSLCPADSFCDYPVMGSLPVVITGIDNEARWSRVRDELLRRYDENTPVVVGLPARKRWEEVTIRTWAVPGDGGECLLAVDPRRALRTGASAFSLERLCGIMMALREPGGCPWDRAQTHESLRTYLLQEAYEVADAIDRGDLDNLREELGDVLYQVVFHARIAEELGEFTMQDVVNGICDKMVARHPFVFGTMTAEEAVEVLGTWEVRKMKAKRRDHLLAGLSPSLPSLLFACIMQKKVSSVCRDWDGQEACERALLSSWEKAFEKGKSSGDLKTAERCFGQALFGVVALMRASGVEPELALHRYNRFFLDQFSMWEDHLLKEGRSITDAAAEDIQQLIMHLKEYEIG